MANPFLTYALSQGLAAGGQAYQQRKDYLAEQLRQQQQQTFENQMQERGFGLQQAEFDEAKRWHEIEEQNKYGREVAEIAKPWLDAYEGAYVNPAQQAEIQTGWSSIWNRFPPRFQAIYPQKLTMRSVRTPEEELAAYTPLATAVQQLGMAPAYGEQLGRRMGLAGPTQLPAPTPIPPTPISEVPVPYAPPTLPTGRNEVLQLIWGQQPPTAPVGAGTEFLQPERIPWFETPQKQALAEKQAENKRIYQAINQTQPGSQERIKALQDAVSDPYTAQLYINTPGMTGYQAKGRELEAGQLDVARGQLGVARERLALSRDWQEFNKKYKLAELSITKFNAESADTKRKADVEIARLEAGRPRGIKPSAAAYELRNKLDIQIDYYTLALDTGKVPLKDAEGKMTERDLSEWEQQFFPTKLATLSASRDNLQAQLTAAESYTLSPRVGAGTGAGELSAKAQSEILQWLALIRGRKQEPQFADLWTDVQSTHPGWDKSATYRAYLQLKGKR